MVRVLKFTEVLERIIGIPGKDGMTVVNDVCGRGRKGCQETYGF